MKELLEEEARNVRDVADVIEEERSKVDGKTPITEEVRGGCQRAGWAHLGPAGTPSSLTLGILLGPV